ncbi:MAG: hypothetical protein JWM41_2182 [Gemmatimonadetes bacterium]|nr:hypothetical protein [Gemmatimonadota bacterium]
MPRSADAPAFDVFTTKHADVVLGMRIAARATVFSDNRDGVEVDISGRDFAQTSAGPSNVQFQVQNAESIRDLARTLLRLADTAEAAGIFRDFTVSTR